MKYQAKDKAVIVLEDGTVFHGRSAGFKGTAFGEICYNTGMTGYQEVFTDPSYSGQLMVLTNVHVGNYGVENAEVESDKVHITGLICKDFKSSFSRKRSENSLQDYFEANKIVAVSDVDTRAIVSYVREKGAMNVVISNTESDIDVLLERVKAHPSMNGLSLSPNVSTKETYTQGDENSDIRIAVMDYGVKRNILKCMTDRGAFLKVFPYNTKAEDIKAFNPNGIFLSNGPGDPSAMVNEIEEVKNLLDMNLPLFGICLGHQLLALANGLKTYKMHNGHRGINHGVLNLDSTRAEVTSQNHGFAVDPKSIEEVEHVVLSHKNLNDDSVEGIRLTNKNAFSVQYHPEAAPGPRDSRYLFDQFINNIKSQN
ncbi:MAG: glutamine-hydrolyzing carbamoyl-phosphate synthase small subunit [Flavobacteriales bacterium]